MGLCISMVSSLIIFNYITYESGYDRFNENRDDIYRITLQYFKNGKESFHSAQTYPAIGPQMKQDFPEVKEFARLRSVWAVVSYVSKNDVKHEFLEERIYYADPALFKIFSFKMLSGDAVTELDKPNTAVISQSSAKKYFGEENPIGKVIKLKFSSDFEPYTVSGIFEDIPGNAHMKFDFLLSYKSFEHYTGPSANQSWTWFGFFTYVLLKPGSRPEALQSKLPGLISRYGNDPAGSRSVLHLQALNDIHLGPDLVDEAEANGSRQNMYFLSLLAVLIVIVAWINYINMTVARTMERTKEIGVRKVLGATVQQVYLLFIRESLIINIAVFLLSIIVVVLCRPLLNMFFDTSFVFIFPDTIYLILLLGAFFMLGALIAGFYPAFVVLSIQLLNLLKGQSKTKRSTFTPGKALIAAQYIISLFFIACTLGVYFQLRLIKEHDKGFDAAQVLCLKAPSVNEGNYPYNSRLQTFKDDVLRLPGMKAVSASDNIPGKENENVIGPVRRLNAGETEGDAYRTVGTDVDYFSLYKIPLVVGRGFSKSFGMDDSSVVLNESVVRALGFPDAQSALNQQLTGFNNRKVNIIGVVKDFYQMNEKHLIDPLIFYLKPGNDVLDHRFISVKMDDKNTAAGIEKIRAIWDQTFPGNPFIYFFAEDFYNEQYKQERQFSRVFGVFSFLSVFIALLGLFGLLSLVAVQKKKEIAIHRILGASSMRIGWILSKGFIISMAISVIAGIALASMAISRWLNNYIIRIHLDYIFYLLPVLILVILTLLIISYRVLKVSHTRPVESLRTD